MLTIISHLIFWPALIWNIVFWLAAASQGFKTRHIRSDFIAAIISLVVLLIPGVYLFGVY